MIIREFIEADRQAAQELVQQHTHAPEAEVQQLLNEGQRLVALQDGVLCGLMTLTEDRSGFYAFYALVAPDKRRQGIGTALWRQSLAMLPADSEMICCFCPADDAASHAFMQAIGFASWFSEELMHYSGPKLPESQLTVRRYGEADFDDWVRLINEGFYPIRQMNDVRPYVIFDTSDPALSQRLLASSDEKFLFYDGQQLVGLGGLSGGEIDPITVAGDQRRKGYARQILSYCTNSLLARGSGPAVLRVASRNVGALKLYESAGYCFVEKQDWFRLQLK